MKTDEQALTALEATVNLLKGCKPNDRGEKDRYYAIVITELEKAIAVFEKYVVKRYGSISP